MSYETFLKLLRDRAGTSLNSQNYRKSICFAEMAARLHRYCGEAASGRNDAKTRNLTEISVAVKFCFGDGVELGEGAQRKFSVFFWHWRLFLVVLQNVV